MEESTRNTIIVLAILAVLIAVVLRYLIKRRKEGRPVSGCGHDCANCPSAGFCKQKSKL